MLWYIMLLINLNIVNCKIDYSTNQKFTSTNRFFMRFDIYLFILVNI